MKNFLFYILICFSLLLIGRNISYLPEIKFENGIQIGLNTKEKVRDFVSSEKGSFSVYYKNLKNREEFGINENSVLTGASLNKIFIISYLYSLAKEGNMDLEEKLVIQKDDIQDYGTGSLRYDGLGKAYSLKTLARLSFEKSDNTAAHVLAAKVGMDNVQKYIDGLGFSATDMNNNKTTAKEIGKILDLIYNNKITTSSLSFEMLDFLKDTDFEDRLPRYLDKNINVYHKIGDGVGFVHDAGIINDGKNPFILVIMTSDVTEEEKGKEMIGRIAKIVYDNQN